MNIDAIYFVNKSFKPIYYLLKDHSTVSTFIYYKNDEFESNGIEHKQAINRYDNNDEETRRYMYFLYKETK